MCWALRTALLHDGGNNLKTQGHKDRQPKKDGTPTPAFMTSLFWSHDAAEFFGRHAGKLNDPRPQFDLQSRDRLSFMLDRFALL